jgi:S1-C subfamily serine protease
MKKIIFLFALLLFLFGCESEKAKIEKSNQAVKSLISNLSVNNWADAYEYYPNLKKLAGAVNTNYLSNIKITSSDLINENVSVFGQLNIGNFSKDYLFKTKKIDGKWKVYESLGLSEFVNSDIHKYNQRIGCNGFNDVELARNSIMNKASFNDIVKNIKNTIENSITIESNTLDASYGFTSGDVVIKNNSRYFIKGGLYNNYNYDLFYILKNSRGRELLRNKVTLISDITFGGTHRFLVSEFISSSRVSVELRIRNTKFIKEIIGNYSEGNNCQYLGNLTNERFAPVVPQSLPNTWSGNGSGIFISDKGYVITNNHVVENATQIEIDFKYKNQNKTYSAKVIKSDKENDLALLKIDDPNYKNIEKLNYSIVTSKNANLGQNIFTLGFPKALSTMGKDIKYSDGSISSINGFKGDKTSYQISAPIQPGNSGGPLFNFDGELIGINSSKIVQQSVDNVAYSIKSSYVADFIKSAKLNIYLPNMKKLKGVSLTEKIKVLSNYVVMVKVK